VLFLDEPMASLDPPTRRALQADLTGILRRLSTAVVWVTHDIAEVSAVADRVTFLDGGHLVQEGTVADLREYPASPTVAEYFSPRSAHVRGSAESGVESGATEDGPTEGGVESEAAEDGIAAEEGIDQS
jgi:ABC-type sulfate/molybdate transport systems ATPase subunit